MSKISKQRSVVMPTSKEDKAITVAAKSDPDARPLTSKQLKAMVPMRALRGRPKSESKKLLVSVRYSPEVGASIKAMSDKSYLKSSGQLWKFNLFLALLYCSGVIMTIAFFGMRSENGDRYVFVMLAGVVVGLLSGFWACLAIRCPKCKARLLWKAAKEQTMGNWYFWLTNLEACPVCGNR